MSAPEPSVPPAGTEPAPPERGAVAGAFERLGADWAAVIVAGVLVLLAGLGLLPSIPFLIK